MLYTLQSGYDPITIIIMNLKTNNMSLVKNTATNAAELYKLLSKADAIQHPSFWPNPGLNRMDLLLNPAATDAVVYERDGSDYTISIKSITNIVTYEN
jgi:hypothetical protein